MKKLALIFAALLAGIAPAHAVMVLSVPITTAITTSVTPNFQLRDTSGSGMPNSMGIQCNFTFGAGAVTTASAWVQTSLDGGTTWQDVASCSFATTSLRQVFNVSSNTAVVAPLAASDGALAANTAVSGVFGSVWRVKYSSTGTYSGGTTLRIDLITNGLTTP